MPGLPEEITMTLDYNDLLRLSRIAESLRRSDPELARQLAAPMDRRRPPWKTRSYVILSVCALLSFAGLAIIDTTAAIIGGLTLLAIYPFLLVAKERGRHSRPSG
jgi:hypothetical protein